MTLSADNATALPKACNAIHTLAFGLVRLTMQEQQYWRHQGHLIFSLYLLHSLPAVMLLTGLKYNEACEIIAKAVSAYRVLVWRRDVLGLGLCVHTIICRTILLLFDSQVIKSAAASSLPRVMPRSYGGWHLYC